MKWNIDHVGITVPDLDQAVEFFVSALGCELVLRAGPDADVGYIWPGETEPEESVCRLAILTHDSQHNIELLEYRNTSGAASSEHPRPSQTGGYHLAFHVEDMQSAIERLTAFDGVRVMGKVLTEPSGPLEGLDWVYLMTPWGMVIELLRWMPGLPYEGATDARLVPPAFRRATTGA